MEREKTPQDSPDLRLLFNARLQDILGREITPENIELTAEEVWAELIDLVIDVVNAYEQEGRTGVTKETAFKHFGLEDFGTVLGQAMAFTESIRGLGAVIEAARNENLPLRASEPQPRGKRAQPSPADAKEKDVLPRLKMLMLLLVTKFGIDIATDDPEQFELTILPERSEGSGEYYAVHAPTINRITFVNDNERNATYVFDTQVMADNGVELEELKMLDKAGWQEIIKQYPSIGKRIFYNERVFMERIQTMFAEDIPTEPDDKVPAPRAPEGVRSFTGLHELTGHAEQTLRQRAYEIPHVLGEIGVYMFGSRTTDGLNPVQQRILEEYIQSLVIPEGYMIDRTLAELLHVSPDMIIAIATELYLELDELEDGFGDIENFRASNGKAVVAFSPKQQEMIELRLIQQRAQHVRNK